MAVTSPDGTPIEVRPIEPAELDRVVLRCWPDRDALDRLFDEQGTIGMAAWEGDRCVAQLHCYRVPLPDGTNENWAVGGNWWDGKEGIQTFTDYENWRPGRLNLPFTGLAWCHSCFHVGRTLKSYREEMELKFSSIAEASRKGREAGYSSRGIGTALCRESVRWARQHDYVAVLAPGAPDGLFEFAAWAGHLPWTTYAKLGFETIDIPAHGDELPGWARGERHGLPEYLFSPPEVMTEVQGALDAGRPERDFRERLMMLQLTGQVTP
jgi:GNAT superfamily N-acetyltransferase